MTAHRSLTRSAAIAAAALAASIGLCSATANAQERIIAGSDAPAASWPSIAYVEGAFSAGGQNLLARCTGTVIAPHWVATAAHCTFGTNAPLSAQEMTVTTGRLDLRTSSGQAIPVAEIIRHPNYSQQSLGMDIALLRLSSAAAVPYMDVARQADVAGYSSPANVANTAGWGWTLPGTAPSPSPTLQETFVPRQEAPYCSEKLAPTGTFESSNMVCAGTWTATPSTTTCKGDSGGPLIVFEGSKPILWGITSWGDPECDDGMSAFAHVAAFTSFLAPALNEIAPPPVTVTAPPPPPPPPPAPPVAAAPIAPSSRSDTIAPRLSSFRIPAVVRVRRGRPLRSISVRLRSSERATITVSLLRRSRSGYRTYVKGYRVTVRRGTSVIRLPRRLWTMPAGSYRLRLQATDGAGNSRTYLAALRASRR